MTPLVQPSIHLNGTSKQELVEQLLAVMEAGYAMLAAMNEAAPNARDYYPQGDDAYKLARAAWDERFSAVRRVVGDVEMQVMKITLFGT